MRDAPPPPRGAGRLAPLRRRRGLLRRKNATLVGPGQKRRILIIRGRRLPGRGPQPDHAREAPHDRWARRGLVPMKGPRPHDADRRRRLGGRPSYNSSLRRPRHLWRRRRRWCHRGARRVQELEHAVHALIGHFFVVARARGTNTAALVARPGPRRGVIERFLRRAPMYCAERRQGALMGRVQQRQGTRH